MPGLVVCNRRWDVGGDDFVFPAAIEILARTGGLILVAIVYALHSEDLQLCDHGHLVRIYYIGMMTLLAAHILVSTLLCYTSMQGSIVEGHRRTAVPAVLYMKGTLFFPELAWLFVGTYWAFSGPDHCDNFVVVITVKVLVVLGWVMFVSLIVGVLVVFDPLGHKKPTEPVESNRGSVSLFMDPEAAGVAHKQLWETRCKLLCWCAARDENSKNAFNDIAELFTNFFKGLDLVPTDIAAGMILVRRNQQKSPRKIRTAPLVILTTTPPSPTPPSGGSSGNTKKRIFKKGKKRHKLGKLGQITAQHRSLEQSKSLIERGGRNGASSTSQPSMYAVRSHSMPASNHVVPDVLIDVSAHEQERASPVTLSNSLPPPTSASNGGEVIVNANVNIEGLNALHNKDNSDPFIINEDGEQLTQTLNSQPQEEEEILLDDEMGELPNIEVGGTGLDPGVGDLDPLPWMSIHNATHYMRYAMGSYGWPLYAYMNLPCGCCKLLCKCKCMGRHPNVYDDNCCNCNTTAISNTTGVDDDDMIYASFYNAIYEIPFYVVYDHNRSAVIVSIRGTLSLRDALTDLTAECEELETEGVAVPCKAHKGITRAAKYVYNVLQEKGILESAFSERPNYGLVITGHSLGAGAATLLSLMLRPSYPDLKCFAFSPPGGLLSLPLARYTQAFVCSVVLGYDLVPRLGIVSMEDLKTNILRAIKDCHKPKYKIFAGGVWHALCGIKRLEEEEVLTRQPLLEEGSVRVQMPCYGSQESTTTERELEDAIISSGHCRMVSEPLYPPGQIIYMQEDDDTAACCGEPMYHATWARPEVFNEILVSARMISDHLPDVVFKALMQLANRNFKINQVVEPLEQVSIEEVK